jgi:hypothetical protein
MCNGGQRFPARRGGERRRSSDDWRRHVQPCQGSEDRQSAEHHENRHQDFTRWALGLRRKAGSDGVVQAGAGAAAFRTAAAAEMGR